MRTRQRDALVNIAHHGALDGIIAEGSSDTPLCGACFAPSLFEPSIPISCVSDRTVGQLSAAHFPRQAADMNKRRQ